MEEGGERNDARPSKCLGSTKAPKDLSSECPACQKRTERRSWQGEGERKSWATAGGIQSGCRARAKSERDSEREQNETAVDG